MSQLSSIGATTSVSTEPAATVRDPTRQGDATAVGGQEQPPGSRLEAFEQTYRRNVDGVMGYFARRCRDPQTVADLTSETFVRAAAGFARFDPRRGSDRAWLFGIAAHVFAHHCEQAAGGRTAILRLGGRRTLDLDEIEELTDRIDAERDGAALLSRWEHLPALERSAVELVDLGGLTPKEAAAALGISRVTFRKRLSRARARLGQRQGVIEPRKGSSRT
jgi:RNA polymerase sigma-70 factor (ECF subfamily)